MNVPIPKPPKLPRLSSGGLYAGKGMARPKAIRPEVTRAASLAGNTTNLRALPLSPSRAMRIGARRLLRGNGVV